MTEEAEQGTTVKDEVLEPVFRDALFHQKRKRGVWREVEAPVLEAPVADTHAHLQLLHDPALVLARCAAHNVGFICTIVDIHEDGLTTFECLEDWLQGARRVIPEIAPSLPSYTDGLSLEVPSVRIVAGCHPHNAKHYDDALEARLAASLADPRVAAVGEIGLDFHYDFSPRDQQREAFRRQVRLAKQAGLPVVLHVREAHDEAFALMQEEGFPEAGTLLHCFNLDWETLKPWVEAGCFVAFGGPLTFKKSDDTREAAACTPLNRLLTETDAPYMTPEPLRGGICGPEHVIFTAARMAEVCGCLPGEQREAFLSQLMSNTRGLLDREPTRWQQASASLQGGEEVFSDASAIQKCETQKSNKESE